MQDRESLNHSRWECKCHVVFIPNDSRPVPAGALAAGVGARLAVPTLLFGVWFGPVVDVAARMPG
ncbi:MAG: hypothetical protein FJ087_15515 [Deltaproteobacteria bacterium]|nr:hypothetical protein [Deltaproteobacteria bacterium]